MVRVERVRGGRKGYSLTRSGEKSSVGESVEDIYGD